MTEDMEQRAIGAYLGLAVGDALGATVEFMSPKEIQAVYGVHDRIRGGGWLKLKPGQITDDTDMSLTLGRAVIEQGYINAQYIAQAFSDWMRTKPVDIGNTVRRGIIHFRHSGNPEAPESEFDAGNGACMRTLPIALATYGLDPLEVQSLSRMQAHITHNNSLSDAATECVIAMVQQALSGAQPMDLLQGPVKQLLDKCFEFRFRDKTMENPSGFIVETMQAVLQALFNTGSFEECLVNVVNRGGDADTTGAIAGMIAGSLYGVNAIPNRWLKKLDKTLRQECQRQALALLALSNSKSVDDNRVFNITHARATV